MVQLLGGDNTRQDDLLYDTPPYIIWDRVWSEWREVIMYCDGYPDVGRSQEELAKMEKKYGRPSQELRQLAKEKLRIGFMDYLETI